MHWIVPDMHSADDREPTRLQDFISISMGSCPLMTTTTTTMPKQKILPKNIISLSALR